MPIYINRNPYEGIPASAPEQQEAMISQFASVPDEYGGGLGHNIESREPQGWGELTPEARTALNIGGYARLGSGILGTALGGMPRALGYAFAPAAALTYPSMVANIASMFAPEYEENPLRGLMSPSMIQDIQDYQPNRMSEVQANQGALRDAIEVQNRAASAYDAAYGFEQGFPSVNPVSPADLAGHPAGWGGNPLGPPEPSVSALDIDTQSPGGFGLGGPGSNTGSTGTSATDAASPGTADPGYFARGGVSRATRGAKTARYGEAGRETAMFVPDRMLRPGVQGREREVKTTMRDLLSRMRK